MTGRPVISAGLIVQLALVAHRPTAISFPAPSARGGQEEGTVPGPLKVQWLRWLSSQPMKFANASDDAGDPAMAITIHLLHQRNLDPFLCLPRDEGLRRRR
jgi:hypothetical protein